MKTHTISILGAGYVGLTTAALLAHCGYKVFAVEPNPNRLKAIKEGRSFFYEQGLDAVIKGAIDSGKLVATDSYEQSVTHSDIVFSCVGTPDNPDGSSNLSYVYGAVEESLKYMPDNSIYIQKSTVPVGTGRNVEEIIKKSGKNISYVSNPEFLRESTALFDTLYFDRVVVGGDNKDSVNTVLDIYKNLELNRDKITKISNIERGQDDGKYISTSLNSAELTKVTANAFLALKISFANSIAILADKVGADVNEVMDAVGSDKRIGRAFLNAGRGYGGGCFPKDVSGLISSADQFGIDLTIMKAAQDLNTSMPKYIIDKLESTVGNLSTKRVCVLGLAFKAGTSDVRKSPGIKLANLLVKNAGTVKAFDPKAMIEAKEHLSPEVKLSKSIPEAISDSDIVIITTEWKEFLSINASEFMNGNKDRVIVDAVNSLDDISLKKAGINYIGIGR